MVDREVWIGLRTNVTTDPPPWEGFLFQTDSTVPVEKCQSGFSPTEFGFQQNLTTPEGCVYQLNGDWMTDDCFAPKKFVCELFGKRTAMICY